MAVVLKTLTLTVATAGTKVNVGNLDRVVKMYFSAPAANTGLIYIGDTGVAIANCFQLVKSTEPYVIEAPAGQIIATETIFVDAATSGDKVTINYLQLVN